MIAVKNLTKQFDSTTAVSNISFNVSEGENLILLGTSGCGKTTTLKMINRLIEPSSGTIMLNGKNVMEQPVSTLRRNMGYVLQNTGLFPHYTIAENIAVVPRLLKWNNQQVMQRTAELMEKLHLPQSLLNAYPDKLSGGQQQRVGLARALIANPPVLLMDEPFGALDPVTRTSIRREFAELDELKKKTIIMVTHDITEAFEMGNRICLMDKGSIVQIGTPAELLFNPANDFVSSFLKEQRLQLELNAVTVDAIWNELVAVEQVSNPHILSASISLWHAMEAAAIAPGKTVSIKHSQIQQVKTVGFEQLTAAFSTHLKRHAA